MAQIITGIATAYDRMSNLIRDDRYGDHYLYLRPGCFSESLRARKPVIANIKHRNGWTWARWPDNPDLQIVDTPECLRFSIPVASIPASFAKIELMDGFRSGRWSGASVWFAILEERWYNYGGSRYRDVIKAELRDMCASDSPAIWATSIELREERMNDYDAGALEFRVNGGVYQIGSNAPISLRRDIARQYGLPMPTDEPARQTRRVEATEDDETRRKRIALPGGWPV